MWKRTGVCGSISIFLILVLVPLYTCIYLAVGSVRYSAGRSKLIGMMNLCGTSALNDYELTLKRQFDFFAMGRSESDLSQELTRYFAEMAEPEDTSGWFQNIMKTKPETVTAEYPDRGSLARPENLSATLSEYMTVRAPVLFAEEFADKAGLLQGVSLQPLDADGHLLLVTPLAEENSLTDPKEMASTYWPSLQSQSALDLSSLTGDLQSRSVSATIGPALSAKIDGMGNGIGGSGTGSTDLSDPEKLKQQGKGLVQSLFSGVRTEGTVLEEEEYIAHFFSCYTTPKEAMSLTDRAYSERPLYRGEWEYLLFGEDDIRADVMTFLSLLFAVRYFLNSLYSFSSAKLQGEVGASLALLDTVAPAAGVAVQEAVIALWTLAESVQDVKTLAQGGSVPLLKTDATWRTSAEGSLVPALEGSDGTDLNYQDYLRLFTFVKLVENPNGILTRMAKVMQSVCAAKDASFDITECYLEVRLGAGVTSVGRRIRREEVYGY